MLRKSNPSAAVPAKQSHRAVLLAASLVVLLGVWRAWPLLSCDDPCVPDYVAIAGPDAPLVSLSEADIRLNAWILAWTQRALLHAPSRLFDANIYHPTPNTLAGSEHMVGVATSLLPLRLFSADATWLFAGAVALSLVGSGLAAFLLAFALTSCEAAALIAGASTIMMPWRTLEISHVQLLGTTWIPVVWLLIWKIAWERPRSGSAMLLSIVAALQFLGSYYLAYLLAFSGALLFVGLTLTVRPQWRGVALITAALALAGGVLIAISLPYLRNDGQHLTLKERIDILSPSVVWSYIAPAFDRIAGHGFPIEQRCEIPLVVFLLALTTLGLIERTRSGRIVHEPRARAAAQRRTAFVRGLWLVMLGGFVLSLGHQLSLGSWTIPLPGAWLEDIVPGLGNFRVLTRWTILIQVAAPILAGVGTHWLASMGGKRTCRAVYVAVGVLLVVNLRSPPIPVRPAFANLEPDLPAYREIAALEPGPMLEIPWPMDPSRDATLASEYMLASTMHWRPLLNGYTGYAPRDYNDRRRAGQGLPAPESIEAFRRAAGVKWIVVHHRLLLDPRAAARWIPAAVPPQLQLAAMVGDTWIYRVTDGPAGPRAHSDSVTPR